MLALDVGHEWLRGAIYDLTGTVAGGASAPTSRGGSARVVAQIRKVAANLADAAGISIREVSQAVVGTPLSR